jgi:thioredoxin reductase (NADPH)
MKDQDDISFPVLSPEELEAARKIGQVEIYPAGTVVFEAGIRPLDCFVVLRGDLDIIDSSGDTEQLIVTHGPGDFTGEISMLAGLPALADARARTECEVIRLNAEQIRHLLLCSPSLGEKWIAALIARREALEQGTFEGLRVYGAKDDIATHRLQEFMHRNGVPYRWIDISDPDNQKKIEQLDQTNLHFPVVSWSREVLMQNPTPRDFAKRAGILIPLPEETFDTVIIGAGPAGLGAAVYAASEGLKTLVLDRSGPGGQAGSSSRIENYAGFPTGLSGKELALRSYVQALQFGATFSAPVDVISIDRQADGLHRIKTGDGSVVSTKTVIISTGVSYRSLAVEGLRELQGTGIYYSATQVEAVLCRDTPVHVIGAGNSAGQAAMYLSKFSSRVHLVIRGDNLRKSMSSYLSERVEANPNIKLHFRTELRAVLGDTRLKKVRLENTRTGQLWEEESGGAFIFIGAVPCTDFLGDRVLKDEKGFILTGTEAGDRGVAPYLERSPCPLETSCPGIFAAGDCRSRTTKRVAFAVGDGALAVTCVHEFLGTYQ